MVDGVDEVVKPIEVSPNAGLLDLAAALFRYLTVIVTLGAALLAVLQTKDIAQIIVFMRGTEGSALIAAVIGLGTLLYGLYKTKLRGSQVASVASDWRVPEVVAKLK
jgi:hypothetical protein